jgi:mersacidin/lichenicidin family type 2 lantibiotic
MSNTKENPKSQKDPPSMPTLETIRAWKDEDYRLSLSNDSLAQLAEHPSGTIEFIKEKETDVFNGTTPPTTCHPTLVTYTDLECCCL